MRLRTASARRAVAARVILVAVLLGIPAVTPGAVAGIGPLPECRLDDVRTVPRGYDDWAIIQVDWNLTLGARYAPRDLVLVSDAGVAGGGLVRAVAFDDLRAMARAAADNGTPLSNISAYRSYRQQVALFRAYRRGYGFDKAVTFSARPGHSEHQLGLTIDFVAVGETGLSSKWESTPTGAWMAENAWRYGWLMSYPKGKKKVTCYSYEPWHYRYVGRELATKIHDAGLTTREYLWANYTEVDAACMAAPIARLKTPGEPRACPLAAAEPSPGASEPPHSAGPDGTGPPVSTPPSMGPVPIATGEPPPDEAVGFLDPITGPLVAAIAVGVGLALLLLIRRSRAQP